MQPRPIDVGLVRTPDGWQRHFVNGLGLGFNGQVTLESRRIPHLQGKLLYNLALLRALLFRCQAPRMTIHTPPGSMIGSGRLAPAGVGEPCRAKMSETGVGMVRGRGEDRWGGYSVRMSRW